MLRPELFEGLNEQTPIEVWRQALRRAGLLDIQPDESSEGRLIQQIQRELTEGPQRKFWLEVMLVLALLVTAPLLIWAVHQLGGGGIFCVGFIGIGPGVFTWLRRQFSSETRSQPAALSALTQELLQRNFLQSMGNFLVECVPARAQLQQRMLGISRTLGDVERRDAELHALDARIRELNQKMGQPPEDAETEAITRSRKELVAMRSRLRALQGQFSGKMVELEKRLEERRFRVERMMLSSQLDVLREQGGGMPTLSAELLEVEGQLQELEVQIQQEQLRLQAGLEVGALLRKG